MPPPPEHDPRTSSETGEPVSRSDLKEQSVTGGLASLSGQAVIFVLRFGALLVLARLLQPEDFGLMAMAVVVTSFLTLFRDLGLSDATIQRPEISDAQVNTLFWVNVAVGALATVTCAASAPVLAWFYDDPRLIGVVLGLSGGLLISAVRVQPQALLKRRMAFRTIVRVEVVSHTLAVIAAVTAALFGAGYWALVVQYLCMEAAATAGTFWVVRWSPSRPSWSEGAGDLLRFGGDLTGFHLVNYAARNADDILIGRVLGAQALGFYSNAYKLLLAPIRLIRRPVSNVVIPALSRLQDDGEAFRRYVRSALSRLVFISMPIITFTFADAERVVAVLLGPGWDPVVPIFRILAVAALAQSFNVVTGWSYTALGETRRWFRWGVIYSAFITVSFVAGIPWGVHGVAAAYAAATWLILLPGLQYCFAASPLTLMDVWRSIWRPLTASTLSAAAVILGGQAFGGAAWEDSLPGLAVNASAFVISYIGVLWLLPGGPSFLKHTFRLVTSYAFPDR
jgi:O-antigen/teichoic acid export membrane protein